MFPEIDSLSAVIRMLCNVCFTCVTLNYANCETFLIIYAQDKAVYFKNGWTNAFGRI